MGNNSSGTRLQDRRTTSENKNEGYDSDYAMRKKSVEQRHRPFKASLMSPVIINLSLMDVSEEALNDPEGVELHRLLQGPIWEIACNADSFLEKGSPSSMITAPANSRNARIQNEANSVRKRITRFLRTNDKYLACGSMLFKSLCFHEVYSNYNDDKSNLENKNKSIRLPVVELPRTENKKPYIPLPHNWRQKLKRSNLNKCNGSDDSPLAVHSIREEDAFSLSVSHQFPFVGIAKVRVDPDRSEKSNIVRIGLAEFDTLQTPPVVGLDIVVFEKANPRLYSSEDEFLEVFRDSFTQNEWENRILRNNSDPGKEFYLRWAMKEAYTKAIGVGMGLEFNSFEIHLRQMGTSDGATKSVHSSVWSHIQKNHNDIERVPSNCESFHGTIAFQNESIENEYFHFYFLPLVSPSLATAVPDDVDEMAIIGCACICVGPFAKVFNDIEDGDSKNSVRIIWSDLEQMIESHQNP